ncbi:MAG: glycosyltransferase [Nitrospirae bacterium]|nr:glycosyltransferase [Nitrospirota bacterium]
MFIVCDPIAWGMEHVPFNSSLLKTIRLAFPDEAVCFYGEESHLRFVREQAGIEPGAAVIWRQLHLPPRHSSFFQRLPEDFRIIKFLVNELNCDPAARVLAVTGNPSLLWALKFHTGAAGKDKKIQVILHGDFSKFRYRSLRESLNPIFRISELKTALKISGNRGIQYIVLEEAVRDAVTKELPFLQGRISVLDHPIPSDNHPVEADKFDTPVQFGYLGRVSGHKGFLKYVAVAADISRRFPGLAEFHVIGMLPERSDYLIVPEIDFLSTKPVKAQLTRSEYVRLLNKLHFACLFYERYYELSASGVLMDCIALGKPIIATRLPIFENLEKRYGDIGYLCGDNELSDSIGAILSAADHVRYRRQVLNMQQVKISRTPEALSRSYQVLVENGLSA